MSREATITFYLNVGDSGLPNHIEWEASESAFKGRRGCEALLLSMWDRLDFNTYSIDLWTGRMPTQEMNIHFYKTFLTMADTFERATGNIEASTMIRQFADQFGQKLNILENPK